MTQTTTDAAVILTALHEVFAATGYVEKSKTNDFHKYKYAGEEDLLKHVRPKLAEAGLLFIPTIEGEPSMDQFGNTTIAVSYTIAHKSGAVWPHPIRVIGVGNDRNKNGVGDKGVYKAMTGANKYFLFKLFQIATGDDPEVTSSHDKDDLPEDERLVQTGTGDKKSDPPAQRLSKAEARTIFGVLQDTMRQCQTPGQLKAWGVNNAQQIHTLPEDWEKELRNLTKSQLGNLKRAPATNGHARTTETEF